MYIDVDIVPAQAGELERDRDNVPLGILVNVHSELEVCSVRRFVLGEAWKCLRTLVSRPAGSFVPRRD